MTDRRSYPGRRITPQVGEPKSTRRVSRDRRGRTRWPDDEIDPVAKAHPVMVTDRRRGAVWSDDLGWTMERLPSDSEDIGALPVEEQAAICCSICASDGMAGDPTAGPGDPDLWPSPAAAWMAVTAWTDGPYLGNTGADCGEEWAEAEARIRTGKIRQ